MSSIPTESYNVSRMYVGSIGDSKVMDELKEGKVVGRLVFVPPAALAKL